MLNETLWTNVLHMLSSGYVKFIIPFELSYWLQFTEILNCFLHCGCSLFRSERDSAWLLHEEAFKSALHLLEVWNEFAGIASNLIDEFKYLLVHLLHIARRLDCSHFY